MQITAPKTYTVIGAIVLFVQMPAYGQTQSGIHYNGPDAQDLYDAHIDNAWKSCRAHIDVIMPMIPGVTAWSQTVVGLDEYEIRKTLDFWSDAEPAPTVMLLVLIDFGMPIVAQGAQTKITYACSYNIEAQRMWELELTSGGDLFQMIAGGYWLDNNEENIKKTTR